MKKKLFALLMATVLTFSMSTTALANTSIGSPSAGDIIGSDSPVVDNNKPTNSPTVDNNKPSKQLDAPTITISKDGVITITAVEGAEKYTLSIENKRFDDDSARLWLKTEINAADFVDGYYEYDLAKAVQEVMLGIWTQWEVDYYVSATAWSKELGSSESSKVESWGYRFSVEQAGDKIDSILNSIRPEEIKRFLSADLSNDTIINVMKDDITKIEKADAVWAEKNNITVKTKSDVTTVDGSKITIVGAVLNAEANQDVVLSVKEPENKVEVDKKYANAIALDIKLLVAGTARENLVVPVAITMPIPAGVEKENLVILHFHGDATEPVVLVPTVNEDGTMTFYVDGFSTFVIANQTTEVENPEEDSKDESKDESEEDSKDETVDVPTTGDATGVNMLYSLLLLAVGVVLVVKRNAFAK